MQTFLNLIGEFEEIYGNEAAGNSLCDGTYSTELNSCFPFMNEPSTSPSQEPSISSSPTISPTISVIDGYIGGSGYFNYNPHDEQYGTGNPFDNDYQNNPWTTIQDPPNKKYWAPFKNDLNTNLDTNFCGVIEGQSPLMFVRGKLMQCVWKAIR